MPSTQAAVELAAKIRALGMRAGVALAPQTGIEQVGCCCCAGGGDVSRVCAGVALQLLCSSCAIKCMLLWGGVGTARWLVRRSHSPAPGTHACTAHAIASHIC
jgi:hypothetical protein